MSDFKVNSIATKQGQHGPVIAGVSTVNSTGCMKIPSGPTEFRGGRGRGVIGSGSLIPAGTAVNTLNLITIATTGDATDFGDLSHGGAYRGGLASCTRGIFANASNDNTYDYVTISSQGGASDFGDMSVNRNGLAAFGNQTRGVLAGGYTTPANTQTPLMEFITIATTGRTNNFGELPRFGRELMAGFASPTRGIIAGGARGAITTQVESDIQFVTLATGGSSQRFGELSRLRYRLPGASNSTRGLTFGGRYPGQTGVNEIDFITIATEGNAQDFGDLTAAVHESGAFAGITRGFNFGGESAPASGALFNTIDFVTIASTGNASDFGDLLAVVGDDPAGISDSHGGLGE